MSQAFIKDEDGQALGDIAPTLSALIQFLTRENNGVRVYERRNFLNEEGRTVYEMSDGVNYTKGEDGRWTALPL